MTTFYVRKPAEDEVLLVEALIEARLLYLHLADDRGAITRALEKAVAAFSKEQTL
jgi:hypothetical protein